MNVTVFVALALLHIHSALSLRYHMERAEQRAELLWTPVPDNLRLKKLASDLVSISSEEPLESLTTGVSEDPYWEYMPDAEDPKSDMPDIKTQHAEDPKNDSQKSFHAVLKELEDDDDENMAYAPTPVLSPDGGKSIFADVGTQELEKYIATGIQDVGDDCADTLIDPPGPSCADTLYRILSEYLSNVG